MNHNFARPHVFAALSLLVLAQTACGQSPAHHDFLNHVIYDEEPKKHDSNSSHTNQSDEL